MSKWARVDRRYNQPFRLSGYAYRVLLKWGGLFALLVAVNASPLTSPLDGLPRVATLIAFIAYAVYRLVVSRRQAALPQAPSRTAAATLPRVLRFNTPPDWPQPPIGWQPPPEWKPDPSWPPLPPGWQLWIPDQAAPLGERNSRSIQQDVKIAVASRDGGQCRQCGSTADLHFDHVIPWSKGGANTVANIQLLCGPCNRRKGADDIPAGL